MPDADSEEGHPSISAKDQERRILAQVMDMVARIATDSDGEKSNGTRALDQLHKDADREAYLRDMVLEFRPREHDPELWLRWLAGGADPFSKKTIAKPAFGQQNSGRELTRTSKRIEAKKHKVEAARAALKAAEAELKRDIEYEAAIVTWAIMNTITSLVSPIFAMGPAWTLMRVVSAYIDPEEMDDALELETDPKIRAEMAKQFGEKRAAVSRQIHDALDLWSGDWKFENELRKAIVAVIKRYEPRADEARARGNKVRSKHEMERSVRPETAMPRRGVLGISDGD